MGQQQKPPTHFMGGGGGGNASESSGHEGQPSQGEQYDVHVGLTWPHVCLVAMALSSSTYKGCNHCGRLSGVVGSWSGLLLSQGRRWLNLGRVLSPGAQEHLWASLCAETGVKSYVTRRIQDPMSIWEGAGARQQDVTSTLVLRIITLVGEGGLSRDRAGG